MAEGLTADEALRRERIRQKRRGQRHSDETRSKIAASIAARRLESALYRAASRSGETI
jgi:hypothetical protein